LPVDGDQTPVAAQTLDLSQSSRRGLSQGKAAIAHAGRDIMGRARPDKDLAQAGAGDRHTIVGPGARPDKGCIADSAHLLIKSAPRGRCRRQLSVCIEGHRPDGAMCRADPARSVLDVIAVVGHGIVNGFERLAKGEGGGPLTR
jgi:hypothetical protein